MSNAIFSTGKITPEQIAQETGLTTKEVEEAIQEGIKYGYIHELGHDNGTPVYGLAVPPTPSRRVRRRKGRR